jgi:Tol biopolymer transport system component
MQKYISILGPIVLLLIVTLACGAPLGEIESPPIVDTSTDTLVPTPKPATKTPILPTPEPDTATPGRTPIPTETPEPTEIPSKNPTVTVESDLSIVYTHESNLWLWRADGTQLQLTDSYEAFAPKISPDGTLIAYRKGWDIFNAELWVVNIDGSENRVLISRDDLDAVPREENALATMIGDFSWVPGKHTIAFNTIPLYEGPFSSHNNDLRLVDADNGAQSLLFEAGQGGKFTYSPDGSKIALVTPEKLSVVNADGSNRIEFLTFPAIYTYSEWNFYPQPVWASDASYLRVAIPPQDPLGNPASPTLVWHIPLNDSEPYIAGEFVSAPAYFSKPLISPDTIQIIYLAPEGEVFDVFDLWHLDLTTSYQTPIHIGNLSLHNWNPDSSRFVFSQDFGAQFYVAGNQIPPDIISDVPVRRNLEWISPDQFIFTSGENEYWELRIGTLGEGSTMIAQPFGEFFSFDFYPKP